MVIHRGYESAFDITEVALYPDSPRCDSKFTITTPTGPRKDFLLKKFIDVHPSDLVSCVRVKILLDYWSNSSSEIIDHPIMSVDLRSKGSIVWPNLAMKATIQLALKDRRIVIWKLDMKKALKTSVTQINRDSIDHTFVESDCFDCNTVKFISPA
jgi:hypothetical protein